MCANAEINCSDGKDNDGDGDTDCADSDCQSAPNCTSTTETKCGDGKDNDNDGSTDCSDQDCYGKSCGSGNQKCCFKMGSWQCVSGGGGPRCTN